MKTLQKAIEINGTRAQCLQAMEELAELQVAISHALRGREHNIQEEIADVEIMLQQLKIMFGDQDVRKIRAEKVERLQSRLEQQCLDEINTDLGRLYMTKLAKYDEPDKRTKDDLWEEAKFELGASIEYNGRKGLDE